MKDTRGPWGSWDEYRQQDPRRVKRHERKALGEDGIYQAHLEGEHDATRGRHRNHHHPGTRHDAYEAAWEMSRQDAR